MGFSHHDLWDPAKYKLFIIVVFFSQGLKFEVVPSTFEENIDKSLHPVEYVRETAKQKALEVARRLCNGDVSNWWRNQRYHRGSPHDDKGMFSTLEKEVSKVKLCQNVWRISCTCIPDGALASFQMKMSHFFSIRGPHWTWWCMGKNLT